MNESGDVILEVKDLKKYYTNGFRLLSKSKPALKAVDGVSFGIRKGEVIGLVGESGCGKSTLGKTVLKLGSITFGRVLLEGEDITDYSQQMLRPLRRKMQMIFQDPSSALNPRLQVLETIEAPLRAYKVPAGECRERARALLHTVGISSGYEHKYPHEMSGGQRQRVVIARAMVLEPELVVCDEPVSALDVSIRAQVLNLIKDLGEQKRLSYLFISHDLGVVYNICDYVHVMYLGKIVESAPKSELFKNPAHPYTEALLSAVLQPDPLKRSLREPLYGDPPSLFDLPKGCRFCYRCPYATEHCFENEPELNELSQGHSCACFLHSKY
jgi:oligopeptide/dipeptide ABC transporter ATP-binding protein